MKRVAEAERRIVGVPVVVEPIPIQDDLVVVLVEIRDVEVAIAVPHEVYEISSVSLLLEYSPEYFWSCI